MKYQQSNPTSSKLGAGFLYPGWWLLGHVCKDTIKERHYVAGDFSSKDVVPDLNRLLKSQKSDPNNTTAMGKTLFIVQSFVAYDINCE